MAAEAAAEAPRRAVVAVAHPEEARPLAEVRGVGLLVSVAAAEAVVAAEGFKGSTGRNAPTVRRSLAASEPARQWYFFTVVVTTIKTFCCFEKEPAHPVNTVETM